MSDCQNCTALEHELKTLREKVAKVTCLYTDGYHYPKVGAHRDDQVRRDNCARLGGACLFAAVNDPAADEPLPPELTESPSDSPLDLSKFRKVAKDNELPDKEPL